MIETINIQLKPFLKWPGGKTKELDVILPNLPNYINNYYEPFVGGGAVYFATSKAKQYFINDKSKDLIDLYKNIKSENRYDLFDFLCKIDSYWMQIDNIFIKYKEKFVEIFVKHRQTELFEIRNAVSKFIDDIALEFIRPIEKIFNYDLDFYVKEIKINLERKMKRMKHLETSKGILSDSDLDLNLITALKSSFYMYLRLLYNYQRRYEIQPVAYSSIYFFIRNYTYSGMFRYNANGVFNVPYGGIAYNNNSLEKKVKYMASSQIQEKLSKTIIENVDFLDFLENKEFTETDFIFLDPPYDTEFSTYDQNEFNKNDQIRLANLIQNEIPCNWMLVIKNTSFILDLYNKDGINVNCFDKSYNVSFMNRNEKNTEHLMITNYLND